MFYYYGGIFFFSFIGVWAGIDIVHNAKTRWNEARKTFETKGDGP